MSPQKAPNRVLGLLLILRKITKFVATRCQILRLKCITFNSAGALPQTPLGELTAAPDPLPGFKGPISKERTGRAGKKKGRRGEGKEGRVWEAGRRLEEVPVEIKAP